MIKLETLSFAYRKGVVTLKDVRPPFLRAYICFSVRTVRARPLCLK